jgi:cytochrome c5
VMPAPPPVAVTAQAAPGGTFTRQSPTLTVEAQPTATVETQTATISRQLPSDIAQRYQVPGVPPTGLYAGSGSPVSATISWTAAAGATGYTLARSTSVGGQFNLVTPTPIAATSFTDTGLSPVTPYYWVVTANYSNAGPGSSAPVSATTTAPKNPTDFTAKAGKVGEIVLKWTPRTDAAYYLLQGDGTIPYQVTDTTYTLTNLGAGPRNFTLIAYYLGNGGNQYYADAVNPSKVRGAALPQNGALWLSRHGSGSTAEAGNYYATIGATAAKDNLGKWKQANGFPATGPANDEVRAQYFNAQDLNLGRDTHCRVVGTRLACYQNNSGPEPGAPDFPNADKALNEMVTGKAPFATVAMDQEANGNINFYAYNGSGALVQEAALDLEGKKAMPNLCTACHGGYYNANTHTVSGASFLPFDVFGFKFASASGFTLNDQQEAFRKLNAMVKSTSPNATNPNNPIVTFIDGMYSGGVGTPGTHANDSWVPAGWAAKPNVYDVFKRTCRTCHLASQGYDFTSYQGFIDAKVPIQIAVCNGKTMPHAEVPYRKFWTQTTVYLPGYWSDPSVLGITGCP